MSCLKKNLDITEVKLFMKKNGCYIQLDQVKRAEEFLNQNNFEVEKVLGCGGQGMVFLGRDTIKGMKVAIKLMVNQNEAGEREFEISQRFDHTNLVKSYTTLETIDDGDEIFFIISEYCSKGNLESYYHSQKDQLLTQGEIIHIMSKLTEGLKQLHHQNIIHSDLKPQNILIDDQQQFKICDFGMSKKLSNDKSHTMSLGGSFLYMSYEQLEEQLRPESDIFSLGAILLFLCGYEKEAGGYSMAKLKNLNRDNIPDIQGKKQEPLLSLAFEMMFQDYTERLSLQQVSQRMEQLLKEVVKEETNDEGTYVGELLNGKRHGRGRQMFLGKYGFESYEGSWRNDRRNGYGVIRFVDDSTYEGEWIYDLRHGEGKYSYQSKSPCMEYVGEWKDDKMNGFGVFQYRSGSKYEGYWRKGKKHGKGVYYYGHSHKKDSIRAEADCEKEGWCEGYYQGEWESDQKQGSGSLHCQDGSLYKGQWESGILLYDQY